MGILIPRKPFIISRSPACYHQYSCYSCGLSIAHCITDCNIWYNSMGSLEPMHISLLSTCFAFTKLIGDAKSNCIYGYALPLYSSAPKYRSHWIVLIEPSMHFYPNWPWQVYVIFMKCVHNVPENTPESNENQINLNKTSIRRIVV